MKYNAKKRPCQLLLTQPLRIKAIFSYYHKFLTFQLPLCSPIKECLNNCLNIFTRIINRSHKQKILLITKIIFNNCRFHLFTRILPKEILICCI